MIFHIHKSIKHNSKTAIENNIQTEQNQSIQSKGRRLKTPTRAKFLE